MKTPNPKLLVCKIFYYFRVIINNYMLAQNLDKIGPEKIGLKFFFKEFMKYVQYFPNQSPHSNNLPLGD